MTATHPGGSAAKAARRAANVPALAAALIAGDRRALARAITLIESTRAEDRAKAEALLNRIMPQAGWAVRLGITGTPGVGKSTFIEAFGKFLTGRGRGVAVLAVDPTSAISGGSILGDKTRMGELARDPRAYIRPSPSGASRGGVARRTAEAILAVEAAGFDTVIVETVGVGQSETAVADMVDMFVLLLAPGGGDELQGIKRGVIELADLFLVTKADGDLARAAKVARADYLAALQLIRQRSPHWKPRVLLVSALENRGLAEAWQAIEEHRAALGASSELERRRVEQRRAWLWRELGEGLMDNLRADKAVARLLAKLEKGVAEGELTPAAAARQVLAAFRDKG